MSEYREDTQTVEIPTHSGVEGFLAAIRQIIKQSRVTSVSIDMSGKVTFTRYVREEEPRKHVEIDFDSVSPYALVRNNEVQELDLYRYEGNAAVSISALFYAAELDHMFPVAFVTGANSVLPDWYRKTTGIRLGKDGLYGFPVYRDRFLPDEALILTTAYARGAGVVDVRKSYKLSMPGRDHVLIPKQEVEINLDIPQAYSGETFELASPPKISDMKEPS